MLNVTVASTGKSLCSSRYQWQRHLCSMH